MFERQSLASQATGGRAHSMSCQKHSFASSSIALELGIPPVANTADAPITIFLALRN